MNSNCIKLRRVGQLSILCGIIFALGVAVRVSLVSFAPAELELVEPVRIAMSLVHTGAYADAYGNHAETAHCAPLYPLAIAVLIRLFGMGSATAVALRIAACGAAALAFALLPAVAARCQIGLRAGVVAGASGALLPVNFWGQTRGFFDAPFVALAVVILCYLWARPLVHGHLEVRGAALLGVVGGLSCLLNPSVIPVLVAFFIAAVWRLHIRAIPKLLLAGALILCTLLPWAIRNERRFGRTIWTRSDFGLELQISNNDYATADEELNVRSAWWAQVHPFSGSAERARVTALGEPQYNDSKREQALTWMATHPAAFGRLSLDRIRLFWFPSMRYPLQTWIESCLTILALYGFVLLLKCQLPCAWLFTAVLSTYPLVFTVIQVSPRYRFPIEPVLWLLASFAVVQISWFQRFKHVGFLQAAIKYNGSPFTR